MDDRIKFELNGLSFTWDDKKALNNWRKHRVYFQDAAEVFFDEYALDRHDRQHMQTEPRRQVIGMTFKSERILLVVYVERESWNGADVIRIISARPATGKEREDYEAGMRK